jgi:hypothetical protein
LGTIFALAALPLFCLLGFAIILVVIIYLLVRNLRSSSKLFSSSSADLEKRNDGSSSIDSRWSSPDLSTTQPPVSTQPKDEPCPACGGENPIGAGKCTYCGAKLK